MFTTTREIGIDAAHRVTTHGSKCGHLHGHRYTVRATVVGSLGAGVETGMTVDFAFLKELMLEHIDKPADHGLILWQKDPWVPDFAPHWGPEDGPAPSIEPGPYGKVWLIPYVPTAENLARVWYELMLPGVLAHTGGRCTLREVEVGETPNCFATYRG